MLGNKFADHFQMAEFLDRDVLKHVADAGVLDVKRLNPILQRRGEFARSPSELLEKICPEAGVRPAHVNRLNELFAVKKHKKRPISWFEVARAPRRGLTPYRYEGPRQRVPGERRP